MRPFSIRMFAPSGDPDGVIVASRDDWLGRAVVFPRALVGEVRGRREYAQPGVYILVSQKRMYIGEGDPLGVRIDAHIKQKDFWRRGVFFTAEGGRLNKAHIQHLESRLIALAKNAGRVEMDNANQPAVPGLLEEEHAFVENFLHDILLMLPLLGFQQFAKVDESEDGQVEADGESSGEESSTVSLGKRAAMYSSLPKGSKFKLVWHGAESELELADGGVVVKNGSQVAHPVSVRFELDSPNYAALRRQLCESGVIAQINGVWAFSQDQFFSSGSAAASVVRGVISNADMWRSTQGKSLGDLIRDAKAKVQGSESVA